MNKKHLCLFKRFAALSAALFVCFALCVPCFASNNASTFQWVVTAKEDKYGENGQLTSYLQLSPFVDGNFYAATFETRFLSYRGSYLDGDSSSGSSYALHPQVWGCPVNYPDWWRADLPLGRTAYVQFDKLTFIPSGSSGLFSDLSAVSFLPQNKAYSFDITADNVVQKQKYPNPDVHLSSRFPFYLIYTYSQATDNDVKDNHVGGDLLCLTGKPVFYNSSSPATYLMSEDQCVLTLNQNNLHYSYYWIDSMANASLSQIEWLVIPNISGWSDDQMLQLNDKILKVSAEVSFWIDANKLPAGLEVGDSFPSSDSLRDFQDLLIEEFNPETQIRNYYDAFKHGIYNYDSVDDAVANSSVSVLSSLFSSFGFVLIPLFVMFLGALLLRIILRKAVS